MPTARRHWANGEQQAISSQHYVSTHRVSRHALSENQTAEYKNPGLTSPQKSECLSNTRQTQQNKPI